MSAVHRNIDLSPVWVLHSLSPVDNLYVHTILFQLPLESNTISSQLHTCYGQVWISCRSGGTTCSSTGSISYNGWYIWVGGKYTGDLRFWIASNAWRVSWCLRLLNIKSILWKMIQASLLLLHKAFVMLNMDTFNKPVLELLFWSSWSPSFLFTRLITSRKYLMEDFSRMSVLPHWYLPDLTMFYNCFVMPLELKGKPWPP